MSRPVFDVIVQTIWDDGFKSEIRGDSITTARKTLGGPAQGWGVV